MPKIHLRHCKSCVSEGLQKIWFRMCWLNLATQMLYILAIAAVETSLLVLYHPALPNAKVRKVLWRMGGFSVDYAVLMAHLWMAVPKVSARRAETRDFEGCCVTFQDCLVVTPVMLHKFHRPR